MHIITEHENKSFGEFLKARKLTANIQHYILHSIAMVSGDTPTIEVHIDAICLSFVVFKYFT